MLADKLIEYLKPYRDKRQLLLKDRSQIEEILRKGADKASELTTATMAEVYKAMKGFK
jgi:hypothetical protein